MRIAFLKDWDTPFGEFCDHWDGIMQAVTELSKQHEVQFFTRFTDAPRSIYTVRGVMVDCHPFRRLEGYITETLRAADAIICWGSLDRPWHDYLDEFKHVPRVLCHAGGPTDHRNRDHFDVFCCESQVYIDRYTAQGKRAVRAFGTNTQIFRPELRTAKTISALYPASFCFHKNQELFARSVMSGGLAVGNHNVPEIVGKVLSFQTPVLRRVSSEALCDLYNMSHCTVIPCGPEGGAQRVVLESMACGTPVVVSADNDKCVEFVRESGFGKIVEPVAQDIREAVMQCQPIDAFNRIDGVKYVQSKWTEHHYASSILEAISIAKSMKA